MGWPPRIKLGAQCMNLRVSCQIVRKNLTRVGSGSGEQGRGVTGGTVAWIAGVVGRQPTFLADLNQKTTLGGIERSKIGAKRALGGECALWVEGAAARLGCRPHTSKRVRKKAFFTAGPNWHKSGAGCPRLGCSQRRRVVGPGRRDPTARPVIRCATGRLDITVAVKRPPAGGMTIEG